MADAIGRVPGVKSGHAPSRARHRNRTYRDGIVPGRR